MYVRATSWRDGRTDGAKNRRREKSNGGRAHQFLRCVGGTEGGRPQKCALVRLDRCRSMNLVDRPRRRLGNHSSTSRGKLLFLSVLLSLSLASRGTSYGPTARRIVCVPCLLLWESERKIKEVKRGDGEKDEEIPSMDVDGPPFHPHPLRASVRLPFPSSKSAPPPPPPPLARLGRA